jgi:hypothetical protein
VPVFSELQKISVTLASVRPQVAPVRPEVSRIGTDITAILTQVSTFPAIDVPVLGHDDTARKTKHSGK